MLLIKFIELTEWTTMKYLYWHWIFIAGVEIVNFQRRLKIENKISDTMKAFKDFKNKQKCWYVKVHSESVFNTL